MRTADKVFIVSMLLVFVYWLATMLNPSLMGPLSLFFEGVTETAVLLGYPGAFLACLLGSASVVIEVPFAGVPLILGGVRDGSMGPFLFDPWLIGLLSGIGATLGDMSSYVLGYYGRRLTDEARTKGFAAFIEQHPRATPLAVFILASTPLPLDPAVVSLGVARFSWWRVLLPSLVGEVIFLTGVAWAGRLSLDWLAELLGVGGTTTPISATLEALSVVLLIVTVYLVVRVDWGNIVGQVRSRNTRSDNDSVPQ
jgi:membrane protein YqaA with SNARE-associated domain